MRKPKNVRGLLEIGEAEANGEEWEIDTSDPLAFLGLGLGASDEAKRLALLGMVSERIAKLDDELAKLKKGRGAPKVVVTTDMRRAAAVLAADDFLRDRTGKGAPTQKAAIELAAHFDKILCGFGHREKPLFGAMTTMKRWQDSVSKGLRELEDAGERFLKKSPGINQE